MLLFFIVHGKDYNYVTIRRLNGRLLCRHIFSTFSSSSLFCLFFVCLFLFVCLFGWLFFFFVCCCCCLVVFCFVFGGGGGGGGGGCLREREHENERSVYVNDVHAMFQFPILAPQTCIQGKNAF